jgi:lysophospholipase L1-like esterase
MNGLLQGNATGLSQGLNKDADSGLHNGLFNDTYLQSIGTPIGSIYSSNGWTNLNDFNVLTGFTVSVGAGGTLNFSGGTGVYSQRVELLEYTRLENFTVRAIYKRTAAAKSGYHLGVFSINGVAPRGIFGYYSADTIGIGNVQTVTFTSTAFTTATNDVVELMLTKNGPNIVLKATNYTTGTTATLTYTYSLTSISEPLTVNTGRFSLGTFGSTFQVQHYSVYSSDLRRAKVAFVGDSITEGYCASTYENGFVRRLNKVYSGSTVLHAAENDRTAELLLRLPQLIALKPKNAIVYIGANDIATLVPSSTYNANINSIYSQLTNAGIRTIFLIGYATSINFTTLNANLRATIPDSNLIDPKTSDSSNFIADGLHYNDTGNDAVYKAILESRKLL